VAIVGFVNRFLAPEPASPRTRDNPPGGYGVREQCVPFTAAAALDAIIPSRFSWGFCEPAAVPVGARAFRSPISGGCPQRLLRACQIGAASTIAPDPRTSGWRSLAMAGCLRPIAEI